MTFDTTTLLIVVAILAALDRRLPAAAAAGAHADRAQAGGEPYVASSERPYMKHGARTEGNGVTDEVAAATTDVAGEVLGVDAHRPPVAARGSGRRPALLKGVGPKFAARLHELGVTRFAQLAGFERRPSSPISTSGWGRSAAALARDRVAEQADYLARGDIDGFEEKFGKLGG